VAGSDAPPLSGEPFFDPLAEVRVSSSESLSVMGSSDKAAPLVLWQRGLPVEQQLAALATLGRRIDRETFASAILASRQLLKKVDGVRQL